MSTARNIRLLLAYDGTDFNGWQIQKTGRTVQGVLEEALGRIHKHPVDVIGSGRTDSGVHARGQVANFISDNPAIPVEKYAEAVNALLPDDVVVLKSDEVPMDFHSRYKALWRTYRYYLYFGNNVSPWERKYCLVVRRKVELKKLMAMADHIRGDHDFTAFSTTDAERKSAERHISASGFYIDGKYVLYEITGNAFLWKMVRTIVGTLLELEETGENPEAVASILASKNRKKAGVTAPARGLFLHRVDYGRNDTA